MAYENHDGPANHHSNTSDCPTRASIDSVCRASLNLSAPPITDEAPHHAMESKKNRPPAGPIEPVKFPVNQHGPRHSKGSEKFRIRLFLTISMEQQQYNFQTYWVSPRLSAQTEDLGAGSAVHHGNFSGN
ncbi:hypothetical protein BKA60DRAFT_548440 [Fusarium oxysporum]|nr:hypothetical protein BKA60DRAFT_548440 [Fusarium oxysporum]